MEVKTSDLTLLALNWVVAKCEGLMMGKIAIDGVTQGFYKPSTNWAQGGPIIEREEIDLSCIEGPEGMKWVASSLRQNKRGVHTKNGPTPLIAAMRCYAASKLGDTVDIPTELLGD